MYLSKSRLWLPQRHYLPTKGGVIKILVTAQFEFTSVGGKCSPLQSRILLLFGCLLRVFGVFRGYLVGKNHGTHKESTEENGTRVWHFQSEPPPKF
jgi:hypothetical protein